MTEVKIEQIIYKKKNSNATDAAKTQKTKINKSLHSYTIEQSVNNVQTLTNCLV